MGSVFLEKAIIILQSAQDTMTLAPMLCALCIAARMRTLQVKSHGVKLDNLSLSMGAEQWGMILPTVALHITLGFIIVWMLCQESPAPGDEPCKMARCLCSLVVCGGGVAVAVTLFWGSA